MGALCGNALLWCARWAACRCPMGGDLREKGDVALYVMTDEPREYRHVYCVRRGGNAGDWKNCRWKKTRRTARADGARRSLGGRIL